MKRSSTLELCLVKYQRALQTSAAAVFLNQNLSMWQCGRRTPAQDKVTGILILIYFISQGLQVRCQGVDRGKCMYFSEASELSPVNTMQGTR